VRQSRLPSISVLLAAATLAIAAPANAVDIAADGVDCTLAEALASANADNAAGNGCADGRGAGDAPATLEAERELARAQPADEAVRRLGDVPLLRVGPCSTTSATCSPTRGGKKRSSVAGLAADAAELDRCRRELPGWGLADPELLARLR
jgi:hypothetical protein